MRGLVIPSDFFVIPSDFFCHPERLFLSSRATARDLLVREDPIAKQILRYAQDDSNAANSMKRLNREGREEREGKAVLRALRAPSRPSRFTMQFPATRHPDPAEPGATADPSLRSG
jgi:hypothetical protein